MRVVIRSGVAAGREYEISGPMTVGRAASCDIVLPDAGISRTTYSCGRWMAA